MRTHCETGEGLGGFLSRGGCGEPAPDVSRTFGLKVQIDAGLSGHDGTRVKEKKGRWGYLNGTIHEDGRRARNRKVDSGPEGNRRDPGHIGI